MCVRLGGSKREHPPVARRPRSASAASAEQSSERRRLVDVPLRAVPLGVRRRVHRVPATTATPGIDGHEVASPRVGIGGGDLAERCPQRRRAGVCVSRPTPHARTRTAVSMIEYCAAGMIRPAAISARGMISACGDEHVVGRALGHRGSEARRRGSARAGRGTWLRRRQTSATSTRPSRDRGARTREQRLLEHAERRRRPTGRRAPNASGEHPPGVACSARCHAARGLRRRPRAVAARRHRSLYARRRHELDRVEGCDRVVVCWCATPTPTSTGVRGSTATCGGAYFRWKFGARFSANACGPSFESCRAHDRARVARLVLERLFLAHVLGVVQRLEDRLDRERAVGGDEARRSRAPSRAPAPSGTT